MKLSRIERFLFCIQINEKGCWEWQRYRQHQGYGMFDNKSLGKRTHETAHHFSYVYFNGDLPKGLEIDHLCRNRACVNPDHLEAVTHRENLLRGIGIVALEAQRTHCPKGHPYDLFNTRKDIHGRRYCRQCDWDYNHRQRNNMLDIYPQLPRRQELPWS